MLTITNDLLGIAVDSHLNDFVLTVRPTEAGVLVAPANSSGPVTNPIHITDPNIVQYVSIAIDSDDNLLIAGYDIRGAAIIDTFGTRRSMTSPPLLRSLNQIVHSNSGDPGRPRSLRISVRGHPKIHEKRCPSTCRASNLHQRGTAENGLAATCREDERGYLQRTFMELV